MQGGDGELDPARSSGGGSSSPCGRQRGVSAGSRGTALRRERPEEGRSQRSSRSCHVQQIPQLIFDRLLQSGAALARSESTAWMPVPSRARSTAWRSCSPSCQRSQTAVRQHEPLPVPSLEGLGRGRDPHPEPGFVPSTAQGHGEPNHPTEENPALDPKPERNRRCLQQARSWGGRRERVHLCCNQELPHLQAVAFLGRAGRGWLS